jgi:centrosomal protein CEP76
MTTTASLIGALSTEQHSAIKAQIHDHLKKKDVYASLKAIVSSVVGGATGGSLEQADGAADAALLAAQHRSALSRLIAEEAGSRQLPLSLSSVGVDGEEGPATKPLLLHVLLLGGRAFAHDAKEGVDADGADEAAEEGAEEGASGAPPSALALGGGDTMCACLHFGEQRFRSKAVPYCTEPELRDGVLLQLPAPDDATLAACASAALPSGVPLERLRGAFRQSPPMHLLLLRKRAGAEGAEASEQLLSSCMVEWRQVLHKGRMTLSIELPGVGAEASLPVGCLELKLELVPSPHSESRMTEAEVMVGLKREREAQVESERKFFAYARAWWSQYLDLSPHHQTRPVKLFALSDLGTQRPVSAFLQPLRASRLIETPTQAAHFVSLLAHVRDRAAMGGGSSAADVWRTTHATLAARRGETEEHALLLCSLLLGFGLDAYVCIGTDGRGPHVWVLTRAGTGVQAACTFWESLSGQTYDVAVGGVGMGGGHPYLTLACLFSHEAFYANTQPSCALDTSFSLDLSDKAAWKSMEPSLLKSITPLPCAPLTPPALTDHGGVADATERALQSLVDQHRSSLHLKVPGVEWDAALGHLLSPALYSYETERLSGAPVGQAFFSDAIRRFVPHGHTFKGLPLHFTTCEPQAIFSTWMASHVACDILHCRTYKAALAVRARVFPMPDGVVSVWVMLAIAYRPEA